MDIPVRYPDPTTEGARAVARPTSAAIGHGAFAGRRASVQTSEASTIAGGGARCQGGNIDSADQRTSLGSRMVRTVTSLLDRVRLSLGTPNRSPLEHSESPPTSAPAMSSRSSSAWGTALPQVAQAIPVARPFGEAFPGAPMTRLPWLTELQNVQRETFASRLTAVVGRSATRSASDHDLAAATSAACRLESDLMELYELRQRFNSSPPDDAQWCHATLLTEQCRRPLLSAETLLAQIAARPTGGAPPDEAHARLCEELRQRLGEARSFLESPQGPGSPLFQTIDFTLPSDSGMPRRVESRVRPGAAFGSQFTPAYPSGISMNQFTADRYQHLPELQHTELVDAAGRKLYAGLQHGITSTSDLYREQLIELSDQNLEALVDALLIPAIHTQSPTDAQRESEVQLLAQTMRTNRAEAGPMSGLMAERACHCMARETAAAALVADREKLRLALQGETVDIRLFKIGLLTPEDCHADAPLSAALNEMHFARTIVLPLRGPDGRPHAVQTRVRVRQFVLPLDNDHLGQAIEYREFCNTILLLGSSSSAELGGTVEARVRELRQVADERQRGLDSTRGQYSRLVRIRGGSHPETLACNARIDEFQREVQVLRKQAQALQEAGSQLKSMWNGLHGWSGWRT